MEERELRPKKKLPLLFAAILLVVAVFYLLFGEVGIVNTYKIRQTQKHLETENERLRREITDLRKEVADLRSNPSAIEEIARKELGLIGKKENVIVLERNKNADIPPPKGRTGSP